MIQNQLKLEVNWTDFSNKSQQMSRSLTSSLQQHIPLFIKNPQTANTMNLIIVIIFDWKPRPTAFKSFKYSKHSKHSNNKVNKIIKCTANRGGWLAAGKNIEKLIVDLFFPLALICLNFIKGNNNRSLGEHMITRRSLECEGKLCFC